MGNRKLSDLKPGESGVIEKILGDGAFRQRLLEMGLNRGVHIAMEKTAPLRDPVEYKVKGYHVSLRKTEASLVLLQDEGGE